MKKAELLKECVKTLQSPKVRKWYEEKLEAKPQAETIDLLESGVLSGKLSVREALCVALIVGVQWNVKFEGVP